MSDTVTARGPLTAADWASLNPTLAKYELGIEINPATGAFNAYKVGDGVTALTGAGAVTLAAPDAASIGMEADD